MKSVFSKELIEKATATAEQIATAKKDGEPFRFEDSAEKLVVIGFNLNGVAYIADIVDI